MQSSSSYSSLPIQKVYIVHSKHHESTRGKHIRAVVEDLGLPYYFIMEGEDEEILQPEVQRYFGDFLKTRPRLASCCYKHLLAYKYAIANNEQLIMVLENDVFFETGYKQILQQALQEIKQRQLSNYVFSIEDTTLRYPPRSVRKKGVLVYEGDRSRMAGAYIMDLEGCRSMVSYTEKYGIPSGPDWQMNFVHDAGLLNIYWLYPSVAEQGSHNGKMQTAFFSKGAGWWNRLRWKLNKFYKRDILYNLR